MTRAAGAFPGVCIPPVLMAGPGLPTVTTEVEKDHGRLALRAATRFFLKSVDLLARLEQTAEMRHALAVIDRLLEEE